MNLPSLPDGYRWTIKPTWSSGDGACLRIKKGWRTKVTILVWSDCPTVSQERIDRAASLVRTSVKPVRR